MDNTSLPHYWKVVIDGRLYANWVYKQQAQTDALTLAWTYPDAGISVIYTGPTKSWYK